MYAKRLGIYGFPGSEKTWTIEYMVYMLYLETCESEDQLFMIAKQIARYNYNRYIDESN